MQVPKLINNLLLLIRLPCKHRWPPSMILFTEGPPIKPFNVLIRKSNRIKSTAVLMCVTNILITVEILWHRLSPNLFKGNKLLTFLLFKVMKTNFVIPMHYNSADELLKVLKLIKNLLLSNSCLCKSPRAPLIMHFLDAFNKTFRCFNSRK